MALAVAGCGDDVAQNVPSSHQWEDVYGFADRAQARFIVVVDDEPGAQGTALRSWLRGSLLRYLEIMAGESTNRFTERDPAAWQPVDWRAVAVSPSGELALGAPPIVLQAHRADAEAMASFAEAVVEAIEVGGQGTYRPLENAFQAASLLVAEDASDAVARSFQETMRGQEPAIVVASTRDDGGAVPIADLLPERLPTREGVWPWWAVLPPGPGDCHPETPSPGRFTDWLDLAHQDAKGWSCLARDDEAVFPPPTYVDGVSNLDCPSRPVQHNEDGTPRCAVTVEIASDGVCEAERGWADPFDSDGVRRPRVETRSYGDETSEVRICEVMALEGPARQACEETLACEGCGSGWCGTQVTEVLPDCASGVPTGLRFVGGAMGAGLLRVVCDLEP